jgi:hypothetical protein
MAWVEPRIRKRETRYLVRDRPLVYGRKPLAPRANGYTADRVCCRKSTTSSTPLGQRGLGKEACTMASSRNTRTPRLEGLRGAPCLRFRPKLRLASEGPKGGRHLAGALPYGSRTP